MRFNYLATNLKKAALAVTILLLGVGASFAQQQINLTAGPTTLTLPDGNVVPMWGYSCGAAVNGSTATCAALNPSAAGWSPVVITVPTGAPGGLQINLTNSLSFTTGSGTNTVPTSIMIVGQVGGGLGSPTSVPSPTHANQFVTWATVGNSNGATFNPPTQPNRVQSFGTEVAAGATTSLTWGALRPGTYLLESGTHPSIQVPMGLHGILVVTQAPSGNTAGTAYPGVNYNAEVPLEFGEIDPNQNNAVQKAVSTAGFSENNVIGLKDSVSGVNIVSGGANYSVGDAVTFTGGGGINAQGVVSQVDGGGAITAVNITNAGSGYTSIPSTVSVTSVNGSSAQLTAVLSLAGDICANGAAACYPPAVNYTPLYYTVNGAAFDKTNATRSLFTVSPNAGNIAGTVLVRLVNAGSRMHLPSIVGSQTGSPNAVGGFALIAEDGNVAPGVPKVQSDVFMAAGKTFDVMINVPAANTTALPIFDRQLSLSGNAINRDSGMLAYISVNGAGIPQAGVLGAAVAVADQYNSVLACAVTPCTPLTVPDPSKGVLANDTNIFGVKVSTPPTNGTVVLAENGTFTYTPSAVGWSGDTFGYCGNGATSGAACTTVTLGLCTVQGGCLSSGVTVPNSAFTANTATYLAVKTPGILAGAVDKGGYPVTVALSTVTPSQGSGLTVLPDANGGFTAIAPKAGTYSFTFSAQNSQGVTSAPATVTLNFPAGSGLKVTVVDGSDKKTQIVDYRWIIEEDRTFYINPNCVQNPPPQGCPTQGGIVPTLGVNFHTSNMPFVAQGCTGPKSCEAGQTVLGVQSVCDVSNGVCRPDTSGNGMTAVDPSQVYLDPTKRYYISVLPGDAADPFYGANSVGHGMGGAPIGIDPNTNQQQTSVTILTQPSPYPPGNLSVFVFEDDFPLNGEQDGGGGIDVISPNEPGLGQFQIHLWDAMGGNGDFTGQMTYDMFNQPLTNSLDGTLDPLTGLNACPITQAGVNSNGTPSGNGGITGMIVTCPKYEADGVTLSPLAGQAVVANLMPGRFGVIATPGADRIARGEEWLQTNTLDGQKAHDSFVRVGEPSYFQEFGPAGYHVSIGFANPKIINGRLAGVCNGTDQNITGNCKPGNTLTGKVTGEHLSRTPDERLYSTGSHDTFYWTQCYISFGDPDGEDFAFTKCAADGTFQLTGLPDGDWRVTVFDQWNDLLVDGLSTPVRLGSPTSFCPGSGSSQYVCNMGDIASTQWQTNLYTRTFVDDNKDGISQASEAGLSLLNVAVRLRDGSLENLLLTDFTGTANFNETFPLFSWYTVETDTTRYKNTGTHVVYDSGGPTDGSVACGQPGYPPCGSSTIGKFLANTVEQVSVPANLRIPGAVYCAGADCIGKSIQNGPGTSDPPTNGNTYLSTGRIDPPWVGVEGWQGFPGQNNFIEFGKEPYAPGENGGIKGHVIYASTRPFDDPQMLVQTQWEPLVPHVTINLYQEGFASDGVTPTLQLVDTTQTSSFDDYAQGFHLASDGKTMIPNMNCPGQGAATGPVPDLFFFSLYNQPQYLDLYNNVLHGNGSTTPLPNNSQFKCYDGMHNWNQVQPAPYDGQYQFPSVTSVDPTTGKPNGTNCKICSPNHATDPSDLYYGLPMLPIGKYVVEVVVPPGYELVKEEDKNILIGDNFIAPVVQQFGALGNVFILPDQASINSNSYNPQNPTQGLGANPENGIVPGFVPEPVWPCVGEARVVPDYISLYPQSSQVSPFAGATRNLCDRKEVTLSDQVGAIAKFYIFTSTHIASKFTGGITDDYTSEFDPFSPQFGEKFAPPDLPVSVKDWTGSEISRVYADHWGAYDGMTYSSWEVNPPNPTGYSPTMMVVCMNDPGPILDTKPGSPTQGQMITDPLFTQGYSQFCYELPFMPGTTQYLDTPVVPTSAFAGAGYNNVDCSYPDTTPAVASVNGDGVGPWVSAPGNTLTINALGDQLVPNYAYSGPSATTAPYNSKTIKRHYGFGATQGTGSVTIGGINAPVTGWSDSQITVTVPQNVPPCAIQQQAVFGGSTANCGQLVITTGSGKQSIDTVTVTVGGKAPTVMTAGQTIQSAIDAAQPGDLVIVPAGSYTEMLLLWKPVRLQGVGAASSIVNANTHPAGKLTDWRTRVDCLFGLAPNGTPNGYDPGCGSGWVGFTPSANNPQVDRLPLEAAVGWDANLNGNLAELLQEPSLMGALEGAAITVLSKGVYFPSNPWDPTLLAGFPTGTVLFTSANTSTYCPTSIAGPYNSNFTCNPSSIDGLGITNSSQGGGGIFVHAWGHNLQIANNRVYNNAGTLSGGMSIGQGEFPGNYTVGGVNAAPGSCETSNITGQQLPYCHNLYVNVHNNYVSLNSSTGDELFSATPAGAGGVSICTGSDYYKFNYNWVCGNLSSGDGGGVGHLGYIKNGDIEHNTILFNESTNPTIPTNGGGLIVMGTPDVDPPCGANTDADCVPPLGSVGPSDGVGPGLVVNANLIIGNAAESGTGGGIAFQNVNGTDVLAFPTDPTKWHQITFTNNIVANNVAGWDGGGVSLLDALNINIVNNTIMSNASTATAGMLFTTLGAPLASQGGTNCTINNATASCPQPAGLVSLPTSATLNANFPKTITCPANHYAPGTNANNGTCIQASYPLMANNVFWQNSSYYIGVGAFSPSFQQNVVTLYNSFTSQAAGNQTTTGSCPAGASYWDIGVRGDTGPGHHDSTITLNPLSSVLTNSSENGLGSNNISQNPTVVSQYCNGSRQPPEACAPNTGCGFAVPPGISDATVPNPVFNLTPVATVDEGNNWVNLRWGPLSLTNPTVQGTDGNYGGGAPLGNFTPQLGSPVIDRIGNNSPTYAIAPTTDFFGNPRPDSPGSQIDIGAIEVVGSVNPNASITPTSLAFGNQLVGTSSSAQMVTLSNTGDGVLNYTVTMPAGYARSGGTCVGTTLGAPGSCTIGVVFAPTAPGPDNANMTIATNDPANPVLTVALTGVGVAPIATVTPSSLSFGTQTDGFSSAPQAITLQNTGTGTLTINNIQITGTNANQYVRVNGNNNCTTTFPAALNAGSTCFIYITFHPTSNGAKSASVTISDNSLNGSPQTVTLSGTGAANMSVTPSTLAFGNQYIGVSGYAAQTLTIENGLAPPGNQSITLIGLAAPFSRPGGNAGGTCGTNLNNGSSCTINIVFTPTAANSYHGTLTITTNHNVTVVGSPVSLTGTGVTPPSKPTLSVLDNFNRANSPNLGSNWSQFTLGSTAAIQVNNNQALCNSSGGACGIGGTAYWIGAGNPFGTKQAASFSFGNVTSGSSLILKATGNPIFNVDQNFIRVIYVTNGGGQIGVQTTTNYGLSYATQVTLAGSFNTNDVITAMADPTGTVFVWKTTSANVTSFLGGVVIPGNALWMGPGSIGIQLPSPGGARVDNFAGATVP